MPTDLSLSELSALADVPPRTIRYYIAQGLLPSPGREGPGTRYPTTALHRLRLIRQLQRVHLPLAEIRRRLAALRDEEVEALVAQPSEALPPDTALDYVRGVLRAAAHSPAEAVPPAFPGVLSRQMPPATVTAASAPPGPSAPSPTGGPPTPGALPATGAPATGAPATEAAAASKPVTREPAPALVERSQWERVVLEPDVELHIRRPLSRIANRRVERLVAFARQLLEEDRP